MAWLSPGERRARTRDATRDRAVLLNQTLLNGVSLVSMVLVLALGQVVDPATFVAGASLMFAATAAAIVSPWPRLPFWAVGALPVVDVAAIALFCHGAPGGGLSLLWAFPAMWLGSAFGVVGVVAATAMVSAALAILVAVNPAQTFSASTVVLPLVVGALATIAYFAARRAHAQRQLLEKQSRNLQLSVDRARRQEDLVTEVLDAVDFGVIRITPEGDLVVTNEAHAQLQGTVDEVGLESPVFAPDGVTALGPEEVPVARARAGEAFENEIVWYGAAGDARRALNVTARRLREIDGTSAGTIVVSRDVTTEEQALRAREDLVASVSHELRTPLTSIMGYLDLALDHEGIPEESRRALEVAERNAERLLALVADILAVSSISRHGVEFALDRTVVEVADVVHAAVEAQHPKAVDRRITIDTTRVRPASAFGDVRRIRQVVDNLVDNAVKYNRDGGHIIVEVRADGDRVRVAVADNGPGISEEERLHIFERFFRSDSVRNSTTHGSGLGLAITRAIVEAHGGEIVVDTRVGEGSTFTVLLPAAQEARS